MEIEKGAGEMNKEFCLSDKIEWRLKSIGKSIPVKDVQEAVRRLKKHYCMCQYFDGKMECAFCMSLYRIFGEKLTNHSRQTKQNSADGVNESFSKPTANGNIKSDKTADKNKKEKEMEK